MCPPSLPDAPGGRVDLGFRFKVPRPLPEPAPGGELGGETEGDWGWDLSETDPFGPGLEEDEDFELSPAPADGNGEEASSSSAAGPLQPAVHRPPSAGSGFFIAEPPPGARPGRPSRIPPARLSRGPKSRFSARPQAPAGPQWILTADWDEAYSTCPSLCGLWKVVNSVQDPWPPGIKVFERKLFEDERLCVPTSLVRQVLEAHHETVAHVGNDRMVMEVQRRYVFPPGFDLMGIVSDIRR